MQLLGVNDLILPVVLQPEIPDAPEQNSIFHTGKPAKKKRNVSEKQRAHLERIRSKALERKREKAAERKAAKATPAAAEPAQQPVAAAYQQPAAYQPSAPRVQPVQPAQPAQPAQQGFLTHDDVESILTQYETRRSKRKEVKRKEQQAQQLVSSHLQEDDVWAQCFM